MPESMQRENTSLVIGALVLGLVIIVGGAYVFNQNFSEETPEQTMVNEESTDAESTPTPQSTSAVPNEADQEVAADSRTQAQQKDFIDEESTFALAESGPTVIFFKANWCPTCQAAQREIDANISDLPNDLVIVTADYDQERALKDRYGITYQHTWVQVDAEGNELAKWNGGAVDELNQNIVR